MKKTDCREFKKMKKKNSRAQKNLNNIMEKAGEKENSDKTSARCLKELFSLKLNFPASSLIIFKIGLF